MDNSEQMQFAATIAEVQDLLARSLAMVQRAKLKCHGEFFEHVDVISKRTYELKVRAEWLRLAALGKVRVDDTERSAREIPDRRSSIDRRVAGMRRQILALLQKR